MAIPALHWRKRAKEMRTIADEMKVQHTKMRRIARDFDVLAERAEQRAREDKGAD